eukprot:Gb_20933 [translate_table: standard]
MQHVGFSLQREAGHIQRKRIMSTIYFKKNEPELPKVTQESSMRPSECT